MNIHVDNNDNNPPCLICFVENPEDAIALTDCRGENRHHYCMECIKNWIIQMEQARRPPPTPTCPYCFAEISIEDCNTILARAYNPQPQPIPRLVVQVLPAIFPDIGRHWRLGGAGDNAQQQQQQEQQQDQEGQLVLPANFPDIGRHWGMRRLAEAGDNAQQQQQQQQQEQEQLVQEVVQALNDEDHPLHGRFQQMVVEVAAEVLQQRRQEQQDVRRRLVQEAPAQEAEEEVLEAAQPPEVAVVVVPPQQQEEERRLVVQEEPAQEEVLQEEVVPPQIQEEEEEERLVEPEEQQVQQAAEVVVVPEEELRLMRLIRQSYAQAVDRDNDIRAIHPELWEYLHGRRRQDHLDPTVRIELADLRSSQCRRRRIKTYDRRFFIMISCLLDALFLFVVGKLLLPMWSMKINEQQQQQQDNGDIIDVCNVPWYMEIVEEDQAEDIIQIGGVCNDVDWYIDQLNSDLSRLIMTACWLGFGVFVDFVYVGLVALYDWWYFNIPFVSSIKFSYNLLGEI